LSASFKLEEKEDGADGEFVLASDVILFPVADGSVRMLDLNGAFCAVSPSGADMLRGILLEGTEPTVRRIAHTYQVDPRLITSDLDKLLAELKRNGLIQRKGGQYPSAALREKSAIALIGGSLRLLAFFRSHEAIVTIGLILLAKCCFAAFGWARTVAAWKAFVSRTRLPTPPAEWEEVIERTDARVREKAAAVPFADCKARALCCWFLLCWRGIPTTLVVGIQVYPLAGHCWCEVGSHVLTDSADRCGSYTPVIRYMAE
jgi:Transglutaminase-like superfamily